MNKTQRERDKNEESKYIHEPNAKLSYPERGLSVC
jgi:hypothetical protein